jgi:hypothetical protein
MSLMQRSQSLTSWKTAVCWVREEDVLRHGSGCSHSDKSLHVYALKVLFSFNLGLAARILALQGGIRSYVLVTLSTGYVA